MDRKRLESSQKLTVRPGASREFRYDSRVTLSPRVDIEAAVLNTDPLPNSAAAGCRIATIWPQPLRTARQITIDSRGEQFLRCTLHDMLGKQIRLIYEGRVSGGSISLPVTVHGLPSGPDLLRVQSDQSTAARPVLLQ